MTQPALTWYTGPAGATWHLITHGIAGLVHNAGLGLCQTRGYARGTVPAGTYPGLHHGDVPTAVMNTAFLAAADVPDETVYQVTRLLLADSERLRGIHPSLGAFDPARGLANPPVPPHPGAVRAYAELGFLPPVPD